MFSDKCGLGQQSAWEHMKTPVVDAGEEIWRRCSNAFTSELRRLASADLSHLRAMLGAFTDGCTTKPGDLGRSCFYNADVVAFIQERQAALRKLFRSKKQSK